MTPSAVSAGLAETALAAAVVEPEEKPAEMKEQRA
jgi:hypothetical protein